MELAAEDEADLVIFGWGGRPAGSRDAGRAGLQPHHRRGRARRRLRHRGGQAARHRRRSNASSCRCAAARTPSWRSASPPRSGAAFDADVSTPSTSSPPDLDPHVRAQSRAGAARRFVRQHAGERRTAVLVEAPMSVAGHPARGRDRAARGHGRERRASERSGRLAVRRSCPRQIAQQAAGRRSSWSGRVSSPRRTIFEQRASQAETLEAAERAAAAAQRARPRRPLVRRIQLPPLRVRRPAPAGRAQGEAGPHHLGRAAHAQRGGDHRAHRASGAQGADGAGAAPGRAAGHRLRLDRRHARRSPRRRARASCATRRCCRATARTAARARRSGRASTRRRGDLVAWSDTDIRTGTRASCTARWGRCWPSRASATSRPTTSGRSSRAACSRRAAADASPSSWRGRSSTSSSPSCPATSSRSRASTPGRREHLEQIPFFTGYAVEIGHLIDLAERLGLNGLGQVDLEIRHPPQPGARGPLADELRRSSRRS